METPAMTICWREIEQLLERRLDERICTRSLEVH